MPRKTPDNTPAASGKRPHEDQGGSGGDGQRHIVTALCYDLVESTELFHRLDIEDYRELLSAFQSAANQSIETHSGVLLVEAGDGGLALFPGELGSRDAASLAIRAGLGIVEACRSVGAEARRSDLHVRVGIATSVAIVRGRQEESRTHEPVTGAALAMATRLEAVAAPNSVVVSAETRNMAGRSHAFTFQGTRILKGFSTPQEVWRAHGHKNEIGRFYAFGRLRGSFIGRRGALGAVMKAWQNVLAGHGEVVLIEGEAGIGKSRLVREFRKLTRDRRARSLFFQCLPGGFRSTLHPLVNGFTGRISEAGGPLRLTASEVAGGFERHGIRDDEVIEIFSYLLGASGRNEDLAGGDPKAIREKARRAIAQALEALCRDGPIVVIVEDIHWIDPTSQDMLAETARIAGRFPVLVVVTSRPGAPIDWNGAAPTRIALQPLDREEARLAIENSWPQHKRAMLPELIEMTEQDLRGSSALHRGNLSVGFRKCGCRRRENIGECLPHAYVGIRGHPRRTA